MELSYKKSVIVLAVLVVGLVGCKTPLPIVIENSIEESDSSSVVTKITERDTSFITIRDTAFIEVEVKCDSNLRPFLVQNGYLVNQIEKAGDRNAKLRLQLLNGALFAQSECDSIEVKVKLLEKTVKELRQKTIKKKETALVPLIQDIPQWKLFLMWIGGISLLILTIGLILKIKG
jgi:hypothetical protein